MALEQILAVACFLQGPQAKNGAYIFQGLLKIKKIKEYVTDTICEAKIVIKNI